MAISANLSVGTKLAAVTPSDSTLINCLSFFVGTGGHVAIMGYEDTAAVTLKNCQAGIVYPFACKRIMSTNTTATDIVAVYL